MTQQAPPEGLGAGRKLRLVDAVAQSVGFMGPVFSIAFLVPQVVGITSATGNGAGIAAPLAVLIAAVGVLGFGWIVAEYARRVHAAGALYDYVTIGLGQRAGGASGLMYYAGVLVLGAPRSSSCSVAPSTTPCSPSSITRCCPSSAGTSCCW